MRGSPGAIIAMAIGVVLIYLAYTGKAMAVWTALTEGEGTELTPLPSGTSPSESAPGTDVSPPPTGSDDSVLCTEDQQCDVAVENSSTLESLIQQGCSNPHGRKCSETDQQLTKAKGGQTVCCPFAPPRGGEGPKHKILLTTGRMVTNPSLKPGWIY